MRLTLVLPPLTQLNTPYPSTAYLAQHLREHGVACTQRDLGLELVLRLFSRRGLAAVFDALPDELPEPAWRALALRDQHERVVEPVVRFLQGRDRTLAPRILDTPFLPSGPRLDAADLSGFGEMAADDAARHLATLYLSDLADLVTSCIDEGFALARYQHHLAVGGATFDELLARIGTTSLVDALLDELADSIEADAVGLSVPFPGNLYGALRIGRRLKARGVQVWMGGGYVNTELREVDEPRLWDFVDALTYDDGEEPLMALVQGTEPVRTRTREGLFGMRPSTGMTSAGTYGELNGLGYLDLIDTVNPAHRLWADGCWNKVTVAHGCYWRKCSFCDVSLDYISRYRQESTERLVDGIERLIGETGRRGFHLVDEAAPPRGLRDLALELLARGTAITWWGNIRFERSFDADLCRLLAASGCVAVTGGLEVASNRLLERMDKGVSVEQVARAAQAFQSAGIRVHAYLMYGFPTETEQETVDSMELVRQLFSLGLLDSAFWHRFVLTRHAPVHADPVAFGVEPVPHVGAFGANDLGHLDPRGADHDRFDDVLPQALASWLRGNELDRPVHSWTPGLPETTEPPDRIARALTDVASGGRRLVWLGGEPLETDGLWLHTPDGEELIGGTDAELQWLSEVLEAARPPGELDFSEARDAFPGDWAAFASRWSRVRALGLLRV
ncbi:MAG: radical SAM protein [Proteobacteria bacterium]|nr:radical SAM protein [Pseudomonadota bacterium]MCP4917263.1 radical SAM protein [Pseudomonadota bacterium]